MSSDDNETPEIKRKIAVYKQFLIGIIKGVLYNLGAEGAIKCELNLVAKENSVYPRLLILLNYMEKRKAKGD